MKQLEIGFIGFGLIGGSIARCIKAKKPDTQIHVYNPRHPEIKPGLALALDEKNIDTIDDSLKEHFTTCDIVFLCAPVMINIAYLSKLKPLLKPDCLLTDVGSVKGNIHKAITELGLASQFIGGHPMAGKEKVGYENSSIELMKDAFYLLTPTKESSPEMLSLMKEIVAMCQAKAVILKEEEHDKITAAISHVPHVIAYSLVNMIHDNDDNLEQMKQFAAGGLYDITRVASSSPAMWQNICLSNAESIDYFLEVYKGYLTEFQSMLRNKDSSRILETFQRGKEYRDSIYND